MEFELLRDLGIAVGVGLIVGLQREWAESPLAGVRTFPLIALFGALCGVFGAKSGGMWVVAAGMIAVASALWIGNRLLMERHAEDHQVDPGMTTEMAGLVMYCVGAFIPLGYRIPAIVVAGVTAALLQWKQPLHGLVRRIGAEDLRAIVRFVVIGMVILPVLPDRA
ncbi:MAG: MgtC/SapB family protein, partial [Planctomycetota bacterium]